MTHPFNRLARLTLPVLVALSLAACGKDTAAPASGTPAADTAAVTGAPGLAELSKPAMVARLAESTLPKGDPSTPPSTYRKIDSGHQVMFIYYAMANLPLPYDDIAQTYSAEYRGTTDSFKRNDIIKALRPRMDREIVSAKAGRYVMLEQHDRSLLQRYNFAKKAFGVNEFEDEGRFTYFSDNSAYQLINTNGSQFSALPVADEAKARIIEDHLSKHAQLRLQTYAFVQDVDPSQRRVKLQVMKIRLLDPAGAVLAEI